MQIISNWRYLIQTGWDIFLRFVYSKWNQNIIKSRLFSQII